jgi:hypothetical protein
MPLGRLVDFRRLVGRRVFGYLVGFGVLGGLVSATHIVGTGVGGIIQTGLSVGQGVGSGEGAYVGSQSGINVGIHDGFAVYFRLRASYSDSLSSSRLAGTSRDATRDSV